MFLPCNTSVQTQTILFKPLKRQQKRLFIGWRKYRGKQCGPRSDCPQEQYDLVLHCLSKRLQKLFCRHRTQTTCCDWHFNQNCLKLYFSAFRSNMIIHMILYFITYSLLSAIYFKNLKICSTKFGNSKSVWVHVKDWMRYLYYGMRNNDKWCYLIFLSFLLSDAQPDFSGTFHRDFSHIAQARWK